MTLWHDDEGFWATFGAALSTSTVAESEWEVAGFVDIARAQRGARVLDLGCGRGRHTLPLAREGYAVTAVDLSPHQLRHVGRVAQAESLTIEMLRRDMRDFSRPRHFHAALWAGDAVGLFEDPADCLAVARGAFESLKPGGRLVVLARGKELAARDFAGQRWVELPDGAVVLQEQKVRDGWSRIDARLTLLKGDQRETAEISFGLFAGAELASLLRRAGFERVRIFGDVARVPYDRTARRLVALAER